MAVLFVESVTVSRVQYHKCCYTVDTEHWAPPLNLTL